MDLGGYLSQGVYFFYEDGEKRLDGGRRGMGLVVKSLNDEADLLFVR